MERRPLIENYRRSYWSFYSGSQFTFGPRSTASLGPLAQRLDAKRVFLVTDRTLQEIGLVKSVEQALEPASATLSIFDGGEPEPSSQLAIDAADAAREFAPDFVLALGGGSNIDLAKACAALLAHPCHPDELFGFNNVPGPIAPLVCLPTTAGTGSEMSHAAVLKDSKTGTKTSILSHYLRPMAAVVDPYLTVSCPKKLTAESGMDALTHALEAYLAQAFYAIDPDGPHLAYEGNHPLGDLHAERAIRLVAQHLPQAVSDPENLAARSGMALAASLAGAAFGNCGVSLVHALEYPVGAAYHAPHGIGNAILLPHVLDYWLPVREQRLARTAEWLGVEDADRMPPAEAARAAIDAVIRLRQQVGLPARLAEIGAQRDDLPKLADAAAALERLMVLSPRRPTTGDLQAILEASY